jgi:hypothetical protein
MPAPATIAAHLASGASARADDIAAVVDAVEKTPTLFHTLIDQLESGTPDARARAADAVEKLTREHADWLAPYAGRLLAIAQDAPSPRVRWHMPALLTRLPLTGATRADALALLWRFRTDHSALVRVHALQGLSDWPALSRGERRRVADELLRARDTGSAAERARARKLLG